MPSTDTENESEEEGGGGCAAAADGAQERGKKEVHGHQDGHHPHPEAGEEGAGEEAPGGDENAQCGCQDSVLLSGAAGAEGELL